MMNLQEAYYDQKFENMFLRAKGNEFQTFFERLMGLAYKADFMACRPWGNIGDRKNDGFLKSERRLFQVYAPNEMKAKDAIDKITEDFEGAKAHWSTYFDKWIFVHNAVDGLPPHVHELILDFEQANPGIVLELWGLEELRVVFRRLSADDCSSWFGPAPTEETKARLGFKDLQPVLESLAGKGIPSDVDVTPVPSGKIEANDLSESVSVLIRSGMSKTPLVSAFLETWYDETLGEKLAVSFREQYKQLRGTMHPNQIFSEFQTWVGGCERGTPEHEMAVLTVLAYYFERCDIFEEPKNEQV
ncbi:MAG: ABC-three component system protein [Candidatus Electrothrix scaldis]|nr:MAG: ABC-three component system protein [Candidatus Electrothrix sp. GW3-3]